jgi:hypothetical protein
VVSGVGGGGVISWAAAAAEKATSAVAARKSNFKDIFGLPRLNGKTTRILVSGCTPVGRPFPVPDRRLDPA